MIKAAIIGTGNISRAHINGLLTFKDKCKIVALVDIYPEKAKEMKEKFDLSEALVFSSHEEMLKSGIEIDLAHICTPPYVHASISIDCMNAGINVLVEKPMGTCLKECDEMLAAEKCNGVTLAVVAQNRFRNIIHKLKILSDSGIAGKLRCAHVNSFWWRGHCYYDLWWRGTWEKEGGGPTLNHAVHHIDMINWITGESPQEVTAVLANVMHNNSEVEDLSFAIAAYADGAVAEVVSSVVHHGEEQGIVLQCENAKISAPFSVKASKSKPNGFPEDDNKIIIKITEAHDKLEDLEHEAHTGQIGELLDALINGKRPSITGIDGKRTIELITAIYKSGCTKQTAALPIASDDEWYTFEGILKNAKRFYEKTGFIENMGNNEISTGNYK